MRFNQFKNRENDQDMKKMNISRNEDHPIIDTIKRFVLPKLDSIMMNSVISNSSFVNLDKFIRNTLNDMIGGSSILKNFFYITIKNEGLGLKMLSGRYLACKYKSDTHFSLEIMTSRSSSNATL
jgi:hypothetical protein